MTSVQSIDVRLVSLAALQLSNTPAQVERRKYLDKGKLTELAESIKAVGIAQPILVRPQHQVRVEKNLVDRWIVGIVNLAGNLNQKGPGYETREEAEAQAVKLRGESGFEIVAGERRVLAAKQAGLKEIQATVRDLTDEQVIELQLIENLQRQDIHELAEAEGYEELQKRGHSIDDIAHKVSKSKATVYARMKLLALGKEARKAFYEGKISASMALLIARIPAALQTDVLADVTSTKNFDREPMSYRQAMDHIQSHYMTRLDRAEFPTSDPDLVPAAGACQACPKRSGNQRELFGDIKHADVCTDLPCFNAKRDAFARRRLEHAAGAGQEVIDGPKAKKILQHGTRSLQEGYAELDDHCWEDPKNRTYRQILGKGATTSLVVVPAAIIEKESDAPRVIEVVKKTDALEVLKARGTKVGSRQDSYQSNRGADERKKKLEREFRRQVFDAVREKAPEKLGRAELVQVAIAMAERLQHETLKQLFGIWEWEPKKLQYGSDYKSAAAENIRKLNDANLACFIHDCSLVEELTVYSFNQDKPERLLEAAKRLKVNAEGIRKELAADAKARLVKKSKRAKH